MYHQIGQLVAMSVVQGGSGIHGLSNSVYNYLSGMPVSDSVAEVPDPDVREMLEKVYIYISLVQIEHLGPVICFVPQFMKMLLPNTPT